MLSVVHTPAFLKFGVTCLELAGGMNEYLSRVECVAMLMSCFFKIAPIHSKGNGELDVPFGVVVYQGVVSRRLDVYG